MTQRSIVLQPDEVRAALAGRLRELWRPEREPHPPEFDWEHGDRSICCPYGAVGDILSCKEVWAYSKNGTDAPIYRADWSILDHDAFVDTWRSSVTMPRSFSRVHLQIDQVEPRLVESITEDEAQATGFKGDEKQIWWQGYDGRFTDGNGNLVHQQYPGDPAPEWMLEPKKMIVSMGFPARNTFRFRWPSNIPWAWRLKVTIIERVAVVNV